MTTSPLYLPKVISQVILCPRDVASIQGKLFSQLLSSSVMFITVTLISIYCYLKFLNLGCVINRAIRRVINRAIGRIINRTIGWVINRAIGWVIDRTIGWVINRAIWWVINRAIVSFQNNSIWYNVNNFCQSSPSSHKKDRILDMLSRPPVLAPSCTMVRPLVENAMVRYHFSHDKL